MKQVLVIDCHDSFVYNLVQLLRESQCCTYEVVSVDEIPFHRLSNFTHLLLSPGPGLPIDYPFLFHLLDKTLKTHHILGVCLGMQAIAEFLGCKLYRFDLPKHGHESFLHILNDNDLFRNIPQQSAIGRYHSSAVQPNSLADEVQLLAFDDEQHIMALRHCNYPVYGVQFHPESVITEHGRQLIRNWLL